MDQHEDRIRQKAHELWEKEGKPDGRSHDHWAEARRLIREDPVDPSQTEVRRAIDSAPAATGASESPADAGQRKSPAKS